MRRGSTTCRATILKLADELIERRASKFVLSQVFHSATAPENQSAGLAIVAGSQQLVHQGRQWELLRSPAFGGIAQLRQAGDFEPLVVQMVPEQESRLRGPQAIQDQRRKQRQLVAIAFFHKVDSHLYGDVRLADQVRDGTTRALAGERIGKAFWKQIAALWIGGPLIHGPHHVQNVVRIAQRASPT